MAHTSPAGLHQQVLCSDSAPAAPCSHNESMGSRGSLGARRRSDWGPYHDLAIGLAIVRLPWSRESQRVLVLSAAVLVLVIDRSTLLCVRLKDTIKFQHRSKPVIASAT
jgi:hypothetical protein